MENSKSRRYPRLIRTYICSIALLGTLSMAQGLTLSGSVSDAQTGTGVTGCSLKLEQEGSSTTTPATGAFSFAENAPVHFPKHTAGRHSYIKGSTLFLSIPHKTVRVSVSLYNSN